MTLIIWTIAGFVFCAGTVLASEEKIFHAAPSQLPNTDPRMNTAGFWISRHPNADQLVMTAAQLAALNAHIRELQLTKDIFALTSDFKTESLVSGFDKIIAEFKAKTYYSAAGSIDAEYLDAARANMNVPGVVLGLAPRYGLVVEYADVRFFPSDQGLFESPGDVDFDQVQNSTLDVGTPVAVVHTSADKRWHYVFSALSDGWVQADRIAVGDTKIVKEFAQAKNFVVVTAPKADLFLDEAMIRSTGFMRMGSRLPLVASSDGTSRVRMPAKDKEGKLRIVTGYLNPADVHEGFLPYTPKAILRQAFAMLDKPYGWGGMYGQQDCSAFLNEVFGTVGIVLPRDSKNQALVGKASIEFDMKIKAGEKLTALHGALPAATLLAMKGHIMLYVGEFNGSPYAIHAIWAYRERKADKDVPRVLNRVVVSDLSLGEGSQKGSLLKRLNKMVDLSSDDH